MKDRALLPSDINSLVIAYTSNDQLAKNIANRLETLSPKLRIGMYSHAHCRGHESYSLPIDYGSKLTDDRAATQLFAFADKFGADCILLANFWLKLRIPNSWLGKVANVHGSLLPAFGGHGMYGKRLYGEILTSRATRSGCTMHLVTDEYDVGKVVSSRSFDIAGIRDLDSLKARIELEIVEMVYAAFAS